MDFNKEKLFLPYMILFITLIYNSYNGLDSENYVFEYGDFVWKDLLTKVLVKYFYNAWGLEVDEVLTERSVDHPLKQYNALKYRGYYYDAETGFYYVSSRYYDPVIGRFINADDIDVLSIETDSLLHYNLYAYCWNNPVNMADEDGHMPWFVTAAVGGALFDTALYLIHAAATGQEVTLASVGKVALAGAVSGLAWGALGKAVKTVKSTIRAKKALQYTTGTANEVGKIGEKLAGIVKNKTKYTINGRVRIPDGITKKFVQEVKNVKKLSLTSQIKDSIALSQKLGKRMQLFIRPDTQLSGPLKQAIKKYNIKVTYLWK